MKYRAAIPLVAAALVVGIVALVAVAGAKRYLAPLPEAQFHAADVPRQLPGTPPALPWPARASAAVMIEGLGLVGANADDRPRTLASVVKVMTALLILEGHPLRPDEQGPTLTLTAADVAAYHAAVADDQSTVRVAEGERITQRQLLEGLLLPSANNFADILARWDAGSVPAFVEKMNARAAALGMTQTRYVDASGNDPASRGTARDQLLLAQMAMRDEVFAEIVAKPQTELPLVGVAYNVNAIVGKGGMVGIKTGSGPEAGGCFVFAARVDAGGRPVTVIGAILGTTYLDDAFKASQDLAQAAGGVPRPVEALPAGHPAGKVTTAWGGEAALLTPRPVSLVGWGGMPAQVEVAVSRPAPGTPAGAEVGKVTIAAGGDRQEVPVVMAETLPAPGWWWRLRR